MSASPTTPPSSRPARARGDSRESPSPPGVHHLRTADDAVAVRTAMGTAARVVVVGAGFIGSEVASAARARGQDVTVVEAADLPLVRSVGPGVGEVCVRLHQANGARVVLGRGVTGFEETAGRVTGVRLTDGTVVPADLVVLGLGVTPATAWLRSSAVPLHPHDGGVVCDATLATGVPGVYAAGDVAHVSNPLFEESLRLEHWTSAAEHGAAAARHALDPASARPLVTVPYFWSDWYGHRLQFVGTPRADEVVVTDSAVSGYTALYRRGDRMVGALTIDRPRDIMKLRRSIVARRPWADIAAEAA
ncbi:NAD(P)/FAD-dependent oxidoreductase [Luteipulveratus halotolerans]|uniref:NAD(P)/FAD-dependent oxidoreductase n=1 Tax=Luteipulveratus halotolerans TaxID=1631356 RepID=UPI0018D0C67A|nr:FAD-dependent oxidoreductase [Luteipulveratus halotolerans]